MNVQFPTDRIIETERLRMRPHCYADLEDVAGLWSDPAVVEYIFPAPLRRSEAWTRLLRYVGHWGMLPYGYWLVEDRETGAFLGEVGFADWKREIEPSVEGIPELGWIIKSAYQGRGFATEAVAAALRWSDIQLEAEQTVALINPINAASIAIAEKVGFEKSVTTPLNGGDVVIFRRFRNAA